MKNKTKIQVQGEAIAIQQFEGEDYISLTDMAKKFGGDQLIYSWMRNRNTVEFLGTWEQVSNPDFKGGEFATFRESAGLNSFHLTPKKWITATAAIGIRSTAGRYGGTFAHRDIAFEFGSWLSPEFKLYLIKEFQRLKEQELHRDQLDWDIRRNLARINYRIHTDAIKDHLIPPALSTKQQSFVYASEADVLNVALFGKTAKQWRDENPDVSGNIRDEANAAQLVCLANLESMNAHFIRDGLSQDERLKRLNLMAIQQMTSLLSDNRVRAFESKNRQ